MTDTTDVLTEHAELIAAFRAGGAELEQYIPSRVGACILALAAEVRALREQMAELETCLLEDAFRELGMKEGRHVTTDDALRAWMRRMSGQTLDVKYSAAMACLEELEQENAALRGAL